MRTESLAEPKFPAPATLAEVIRLADDCEDERDTLDPPGHVLDWFDDFDRSRSRPRRDRLVRLLRALPPADVAGLYALYRVGDGPRPSRASAVTRYRVSFDLAILPIHGEHGADDLAAKGSLADGLRRGCERIELRIERDADLDSFNLIPQTL